MSQSRLQKILTSFLDEENINLRGTKIEVVLPSSIKIKDTFNRKKRNLIDIFNGIERKVRERADPFYDMDIERFREIGGYSIIKQIGTEYLLESVYETEGETARPVVFPGRGLDLQWSCNFSEIDKLNINWEEVIFFIRYHSHPFTNNPHLKDINAGIKNLEEIPKNIEYLQTIYSKIWSPNFLWLKHYW